MKTFISTLLIGFSCSILCSWVTNDWTVLSEPDFNKVFKRQESLYKEKASYSLLIRHSSYENHTTTSPYEKVEGYFKKEGTSYHSFLLGMETIQNKEMKIVIDSSSKKILIAPADAAFQPLSGDEFQKDMKGCGSIKCKEQDKGKIYRLDYKEGEGSLEAIEYLVSKDGLISKMVMFYRELSYNPGFRQKEEKYKPRIEVELTEFKTAGAGNKDDFEPGKYVTLSGSKYKGIGKYQQYSVFDTRVPKKK
ncbi:MAG: hypothetical protein ACHQIM_02570 [Sphingobacteriales bacterium]